MVKLRFAEMQYTEIKRVLFDRLTPEQASEQQCYEALAAIDVLQVTRPEETENAGTRVSLRSLEAMRQKFEKRLAVHGWNGRTIESVIPTDDLD